jgi:hypothetical protein
VLATSHAFRGQFSNSDSANLLQRERARPRNSERRNHLDRRSFLSITACGIIRTPSAYPPDDHASEEHWKKLGYYVAQILRPVNQIYVQRGDRGDGLRVEFVDYERMPDGDIHIIVPCVSAELGLFVVGSVAYELSLWLQQRTSAVEALITLEIPATVILFAHRERGRDIVVMLQRNEV